MDNETKENNNIIEVKQLENEVIADILQLHCAAYMGDLNMVKECIEEKGVDVNALASCLILCYSRRTSTCNKILSRKGGKESL